MASTTTTSDATTPWVVLKFGGTSVSTAPRWDVITNRAKDLVREGKRVLIVVSAVSGVTNLLLNCVEEALQLSANDRDVSAIGVPLSGAVQSPSMHFADEQPLSLDEFASFHAVDSKHADLTAEMEKALGVSLARGRGGSVGATAADQGTGEAQTQAETQTLTKTLHKQLGVMLEGVRLTGEATPRTRARVLAIGELTSSYLGWRYMRRKLDSLGDASLGQEECPIARVDARRLLQSVEKDNTTPEDCFLEASVDPRADVEGFLHVVREAARECAEDCGRSGGASTGGASSPALPRIVITQGFIARTPRNESCVLGRGGSDTSAALLAALCGAERLEIWTDVHGLFTCDPRFVRGTRLISSIGYREAQELGAMGAKVIHPRCLVPAAWAGIPVDIRNTMDPDSEHTRIEMQATDARSSDVATGAAAAAAAAAAAVGVGPVTVTGGGSLGRRLSLGANGTEDNASIGSSGSSGASVGGGGSVERASVLAVARRKGQAILSVYNPDMWGASGFLAKVFAPFEALGISVDLIATSQYSVSLTLDHIPGGIKGVAFTRLVEKLKTLGSVTKRYPVATVSVVGRHLRSALHDLGPAFSVLQTLGATVYMLTESAEDLNLSLVVDEASSADVVCELHERLFGMGTTAGVAAAATGGGGAQVATTMIDKTVLGSTWEELCAGREAKEQERMKEGKGEASQAGEGGGHGGRDGEKRTAGTLPPQMRLPR